jgi:hypothetical protein
MGYLLGTMMSRGKLRDYELAYARLSDATRQFLRLHLQGAARLLPVARDDLLALKQGLLEADLLVGLCLQCDTRYEGLHQSHSRPT